MSRYCGRFAPSPTGPLHFGSLLAAVASYCEARAHGGVWCLRMEDLDEPRCLPGAADDIVRVLERCGFAWDGEVMFQSRRTDAYAAALERLEKAGRVFPCACSRKEIADSNVTLARSRASSRFSEGGESEGPGELIYPGTCRNGLPPGRGPRSWRVRVDNEEIAFDDAIQGPVHQHLGDEVGDFVLRRADGYFAYQLAVVVDDAEQGVTDVVRGADLLGSTPRQIHLQRLLGFPRPRYAHVPIAVNRAGEKLSKQTFAPAIDADRAAGALLKALTFLGQQPPAGLAQAKPADVWQWALPNWSLARVPAVRTRAVS